MASVPLLIPVGAQFLDNTGKVLSGGFLYTYQAGTTNTPQATFSDEGLTTSNPNPIPLNSAGRCASSFSGSEINVYPTSASYKLVLTDSAGNQIWSHDFVDPAAPFNVLVGATFVNPTITNPTVTTGTFSSPTITTPAITGGTITNATLTNPTSSGGTLTNATLVTPTITTPTITGGTQSAPTIASPVITTSIVSTSALLNNICQGRLTLSTGVPVVDNVSGAATIYFTPYSGSQIALYDGSTKWTVLPFTETALPLGTLTSGLPYDVFGFNNSGALGLELLAWSSGTARATNLVTQDGVLVKTGATTRRYLGTFYTTSTTTTEDSFNKRNVWNYYNRVQRRLNVVDGTASWNYTLATWRQANGNTANQLEIVNGWAEDAIDVTVKASASNLGGGVNFEIGIGLDSTTTPGQAQFIGQAGTPAAATLTTMIARAMDFPAVGHHVYVWLEASNAASTTSWIGTGSTVAGNVNANGSAIYGLWRS